ncbi:102aa long hypothetical protein [Pyrococcus horikoshii OT3]|uniref:Uncharacterized protein n=1 Tax=Pyrococcus horikoshii (strain ATCC 700860 / DSM 12428 / JCM 9974 / NBRC 100139 / OT-3) TaxID=70601 RepID=O58779_PYRHO|nr:102aa long hypothetical protein [Pyrococcus horikoshii OT3]
MPPKYIIFNSGNSLASSRIFKKRSQSMSPSLSSQYCLKHISHFKLHLFVISRYRYLKSGFGSITIFAPHNWNSIQPPPAGGKMLTTSPSFSFVLTPSRCSML